MSRVFVIQQPTRWDDQSRAFQPKYDLTPAREFGEVVDLLSPRCGPFNHESVIAELKQKLENFSDDDYLLLTGNPCLIGWATALAADANEGRVRLLQWSGKDRRYVIIESDLGWEE